MKRKVLTGLGCLGLLCCVLVFSLPIVQFVSSREPAPGPDTPVFDVALEDGPVTPSEKIVVDEGDYVSLRISADQNAGFGPVGGPVYSVYPGDKIQFQANRVRRFEFLDASSGERIGEEVVVEPGGEG